MKTEHFKSIWYFKINHNESIHLLIHLLIINYINGKFTGKNTITMATVTVDRGMLTVLYHFTSSRTHLMT